MSLAFAFVWPATIIGFLCGCYAWERLLESQRAAAHKRGRELRLAFQRGFNIGVDARQTAAKLYLEINDHPSSAEYIAAINWGKTIENRRAFERALTEASGGNHAEYVRKWS